MFLWPLYLFSELSVVSPEYLGTALKEERSFGLVAPKDSPESSGDFQNISWWRTHDGFLSSLEDDGNKIEIEV